MGTASDTDPVIGPELAGSLMTADEFDTAEAWNENYHYELLNGVLAVVPPASEGERGPNDLPAQWLRNYHAGPDKWGEHYPAANGKKQSPVELVDGPESDQTFTAQYGEKSVKDLVDNGHTWQVNFKNEDGGTRALADTARRDLKMDK